MGQSQDVEDSVQIGSEYVRMFRTIKWKDEFNESQKVNDKNPIFHIMKAIKQPSRIRSKDQFIAALKEVTKGDTNAYNAYKEYIDKKLVCITKPFIMRVYNINLSCALLE